MNNIFEEELREVALTEKEMEEMKLLEEKVADGKGGMALICGCVS